MIHENFIYLSFIFECLKSIKIAAYLVIVQIECKFTLHFQKPSRKLLEKPISDSNQNLLHSAFDNKIKTK